MDLPKDPYMLLSYVNTQLRDNYGTLEDLCKSLGLDENQIVSKLEEVGYTYNEELNRFG